MTGKNKKPKEKSIQKGRKNNSSSFSFLRNFKLVSGLIAIFSFVLYFNTLWFDYCGDDTILIRENKLVNNGLGHADLLLTKGTFYGYNQQNYGAYRPLAMLSFAAEAQVFGLNPFTGHLINILLYIACGILLYRLLLLFFPGRELTALLITLLFMAHPVHSEVVANIKSRDELLAFLLSFLIPCFLTLKYGFARKGITSIAFASFFLGLFAKETAATFIAPLVLAPYFFKNLNIKNIFLFYFLPLAFLSGIYLLARNIFLDAPPEVELSFTNTLFHTQTFSEKIGTLLFILLKNIEKLFFPVNLSWDYSYKEIPVTELFSPAALFSLLLLVSLMAFAVYKTKSKSSIAFFIWLFFSGMILFSHILVMLAPNIADRFLFVPSLAFCAILVLAVTELVNKLNAAQKRNQYLVAPLAVIIILFSARTIARNNIWKNNEAMFRSGIADAPGSYYTHQTLGQYLSATADSSIDANEKQKLYAEAAGVLEKANEICPLVQDNWYLQGRCAYLSGDLGKAEYAYLQAIERFDKPKKEALYNLAVLYKSQKNLEKAILYLKKVNEAEENFMGLYALLGEIYLTKNDLENAQFFLNKSLKKNPAGVDVLNNLGVYYFTIRDFKNAAEYFSKAVSYEPCSFNGLKNLAATYQTENNFEQAINYYQKLIQCYPNNETGYVSIINLYSSTGNMAIAKEYQEKLNKIRASGH